MKKTKLFFLSAMLGAFSLMGYAQNEAASYMNSISEKYRTIQVEMWDYTSSVAHGKSARKVEANRNTLIETTYKAMNEVKKMPAFEGDASYRDSVVSFLHIYHLIVKEDYAKIVDMEEISERSYNDMEAYMNAKSEASEKMNAAAIMISEQQQIFAEKHGITLVQANDDLSNKMKLASNVYQYYNKLYLIFFKSYSQERYLIEAINKKDLTEIESNRTALLAASNEGLELLGEVGTFKDDNSVVVACTDLLRFYKDEAENKMAIVTNYLVKAENFNVIKTSFDAIKPNNRTKEDVDKYNNAVNEMNDASTAYNNVNAELSTNRQKYIEAWNNASVNFTDKHVPKK